MSAGGIRAELRQMVRRRAAGQCEYCLLSEEDAFFSHEADHIIAEKHGGSSTADNLALACFDCNRFKGSDIASLDPATGRLVRLFNPRTDRWADHFRAEGGRIEPLTAIGRATVQLLRMNLSDRVEVREWLARARRWPPPSPSPSPEGE